MTIETITIPLAEWKEIADADNRACEYAHQIGVLEAEIERLRAAAAGANAGAENEAEAFIQAAIDSAPEPLRRLGEYLTRVLDEDEWAAAEPMLLALAAGANAGAEWQPVETAPKDGTQVLLWCGDPVCGYWSGDDLDPERGEDGWIVDFDWNGMSRPTHWTPLPSAPADLGD